jgi:thiosulfate reductase cytochrome b subunit
MMKTANRKNIHVTPLWLRVWHWVAALLFMVLVLTGIVLTYSSSEFALIDYKLATDLHDITGRMRACGRSDHL